MDLDFTESQKLMRAAAREFLSKECPAEKVRELEESEKGYSPEMWEKMAGMGWMGLMIPEAYGGAGGEFMDLVVLLEEMGRAALPSPFFSTVVLCALPLLQFGSDEQKRRYLPEIASGKKIWSLALTEFSGSYEASEINTRAIPEGTEFILDGTKFFVNYANVADYLLVVCRTEAEGKTEEGITLFLVDAKSPGIEVKEIPTTALDKQCEVAFKGVRVPREHVLGEVDRGWPIVEWILERAAVAKCAEMIGGCEMVLEMANKYAKERVQYKRPIADFQVIQHYLVNMWMRIETSKNITYEAAWRVGEGLPCAKQVSAAKAWVSESFKYVTERGVNIYGALGTTREVCMGLYYRRAWAWDPMFGDANFHRERVARELGL